MDNLYEIFLALYKYVPSFRYTKHTKRNNFENFHEDHTSWYSSERRFSASYLTATGTRLWENNSGDDEATRAAVQPEPGGGDDTKKGSYELARMSCLFGSFQTYLTGI